jgi:hypothetical protein
MHVVPARQLLRNRQLRLCIFSWGHVGAMVRCLNAKNLILQASTVCFGLRLRRSECRFPPAKGRPKQCWIRLRVIPLFFRTTSQWLSPTSSQRVPGSLDLVKKYLIPAKDTSQCPKNDVMICGWAVSLLPQSGRHQRTRRGGLRGSYFFRSEAPGWSFQ